MPEQDEAELENKARNDPDWRARVEAVMQMSDEGRLNSLVDDAPHYHVQVAALRRLETVQRSKRPNLAALLAANPFKRGNDGGRDR